MNGVFLGSEQLASGAITRGQLRWNYRAIYPDVYETKAVEQSLYSNTVGAWLWSKRRGVIAGRAAAALHGALWIDQTAPVEMLWNNCNPPPGIVTRDERFTPEQVVEIDDMAVTSIQRTAFDLGRHLSRDAAVVHLDALARATGVAPEHVLPLADLYKGARGVRQLWAALELLDSGAQSPRESLLRLMLMDAGFPRPQTQIPLLDSGGYAFAYLDMGWEEVMIAVEYDGDQHRTDRTRYAWDIRRNRMVERLGWIHIRVIAEDRRKDVLDRVRQAWLQRETEARVVKRPA
jgi:hypothetical protein